MNAYTLAEQRKIAIAAVRSEMRRYGDDPKQKSAEFALTVLDDIARSEPGKVSAQWYINASNNQIRLFEREW